MASHEPQPGKCGEPLTKKPGYFCDQGAGARTDHKGFGACWLHRGRTPPGDKHGKKLMAIAECETFGIPVPVDPHRALLEELWRTNGWIHHLHSKLLSEGEEGVSAEGKPSLTWQLYDQQRQQLAKVAESCARTGVEERLTRVAEMKADMYVLSMQAGLRAIGVDPMGEQGRVFLEAGLAALPETSAA